MRLSRGLLRGNISVMTLTSGLWNLAGELVWPFWALCVLHLGGSYFDVGLISATGSILGAVGILLGGALYGRYFQLPSTSRFPPQPWRPS